MATVVGDIAISVGADIAPLVTDLARGQAAVNRFGASAQASASGGMRAFATAAGAIVATAATAGLGLAALTKRALDQGGVFFDLSKKTGVHVAALQAMSQVANEAGVSTETLTGSLTRMQRNIAGLSEGTQAQVAAFGRLGISMGDLAGRSPDQQFAVIAEAIDSIEDPALRTAAAMDVFGKAGADLIPMMGGYSDALSDVAEKQRLFGISMTDEQAASLDAAGDALGRLSMAMEGFAIQLAVNVAPAIITVTEAITDLMEAATYSAEEINQMAIDMTFDGIREKVDTLRESAELTAATFASFGDGKVSQALTANVVMIDEAIRAFESGKISAEEYRKRIMQAEENVRFLYDILGEVSGTDMSGAIEEMGGLAKAIGIAFDAANRLMGLLPNLQAPGPSDMESDIRGRVFTRSNLAPTTSLRPNRPGVDSAIFGDGTASAGGGGGQDLQAELDALRESFRSEQQILEDQYAERLAKLEKFREAELLTQQEYNDLEAQAQAEHQKALADIEAQAIQVKMAAMSGAFGDLGALMQTQNEKLFRVGKAASIAKAIIDGYEAATAAWKKGMQIGGPGLAAAFTAASLARTGAMIAGINRTQMGGGQSPSVGGNAGTPAASAPAAPLDVRLTGFGPGDLITGSMIGQLFDRLREEGGDRGVRVFMA